jgi:K(+)-stimulated pyrophosphate-energized sodium pump
MTTNQSNSGYGLHFWVALLLALLLIGMWFMGYGPGGSKCVPAVAEAVSSAPAAVSAVTAPTTTPTPEPAAPAPAVIAAAAPVAGAMKEVASVPAAKVYFALDKTGVPADTDKTLADVVAYLKANSSAKASVSGFHDPSGSKQHNEDLAKNRALNVQAALDKLGIGSDRVILQKPVETTGSGKPSDARRVEVSVVQP